MGNITIKGVLKDPSAQIAVNVPVLIISKVGYGDTLVSSQVTRKTDATGGYDFPLVYGVHSIAVRFYDKFVTLGTVVVNSSSTAEMTINELLELSATEPPTPDWVVRIEQLTTEATAAANKAENEADRATAQVPLAEAQVTLAKNEVVKATAQADRAKSEADRATQVTGLDTVEQAVDHALAEFAGIMTESEARAINATNNNHFDASGMVDMGKQRDASVLTPVNEGMYVYHDLANVVRMGVVDGASSITGTSKTNFPVTHIAGAVLNVLALDALTTTNATCQFMLPEAEDGTRTFNKATGESITHPDVATAFALAATSDDIEVVTHPVDLVTLEYYEEELTGRQEIFECIQSLSTTFGTTSVPTVLSTRKLSYFQQYDGQFPEVTANPDFINDRYRCVVWPDLTDEQKRKVAAYMGEKLFMGVNGHIVNGRLRARTIRGLGNGDWENINSNNPATSSYLGFSNVARVNAQGSQDAVTSLGVSTADQYRGSYSTSNDEPYVGVFTVHSGNKESHAYQGRCFMYVVATVPRANKGAYHPDLNPWGTTKLWSNLGNPSSDYWYDSEAKTPKVMADCFSFGEDKTVGDVPPFTSARWGGISYGQSGVGHPGGIFYDGIEAGGLNGVIDWRLGAVANDSPEESAKVEAKVENGTYRGLEQFLNVSMSGEFMFTYTETVGGLVQLPRKCLTSTVECVHSSDGGVTWVKTNPSVTGNSVTLPSGGKSVVSFKVSAKVAKPSTVKPVLNVTKGLLGVTVTQSHDKAVLAEAVAGIILKSDASGIVTEQSQAVKYLVEDTIKRLKTLPTDMVAPTNSSQAIKIAVYQISNNGQTSLGIIANTMTHNGTDWGELEEVYVPSSGSESFTDSNGTSQQAIATELSIPTGWTSNHARPGPQVPGVDL
ncbi:putative coil containing protein [Vibrio phage 393E50-1]|nr:putative coil containing protein [Vibrio phage 393E50-1]